jgi:hypothetical protein
MAAWRAWVFCAACAAVVLIAAITAIDFRQLAPCKASDIADRPQVCAAWAGVAVTLLSAIASTFVGIVAVLIAHFAQRSARVSRVRAGLFYVGHALVVIHSVRGALRNSAPDADIFLQELLDRIQPAMKALDVYFHLSVDEQKLNVIAINLHTTIYVFVGLVEFGKTQAPTGKVGALRLHLDKLDPAFAKMLVTLRFLAARYGVEFEEPPLSEALAG